MIETNHNWHIGMPNNGHPNPLSGVRRIHTGKSHLIQHKPRAHWNTVTDVGGDARHHLMSRGGGESTENIETIIISDSEDENSDYKIGENAYHLCIDAIEPVQIVANKLTAVEPFFLK